MPRDSSSPSIIVAGPRNLLTQSAKPRALLLLALAVVSLLTICPGCRRRVSREHDRVPTKDYQYLTARVGFAAPQAELHLTRRMAEQDLDELEWLIENRYSYRDLRGVDYRAALDAIRAGFGDSITRSDLTYQLLKLLSLFGDGHTRIRDPSLKRSLCSEFLPFLVEESRTRLVAFKADRSAFLHPGFPYLRAMDGIPIDAWLEAAGRLVPQGSPQLHRAASIRYLRYIECLRKDLGLATTGPVQVSLEDPHGRETKQLDLPLAAECPEYGSWPPTETATLPGNIGYLHIIPLMDCRPEFLHDLADTMRRCRETSGLIIDIRGNEGGNRAPLRVLFPFFMADDDSPRVVNVAAYRLGVSESEERFRLRHLYPASWPGWSPAEREAIRRFAATFRPAWVPPEGEFSQWHYFVISPRRDEGCFHYDKPVVVLMDSYDMSACDIFLGAFKDWRNVTLMGLPSGGTSGCRRKYDLRHSYVGLYLSSMASFRPTGQLYDGNGIQPDIRVEPVPTDFIGKTDTTLAAAVSILSANQD